MIGKYQPAKPTTAVDMCAWSGNYRVNAERFKANRTVVLNGGIISLQS
jgi:hypothetical protein